MYTDNLLSGSGYYPAPQSWFTRDAQSQPSIKTDREDMRLIEQMICNEVLESAKGAGPFAKGLRRIRENGPQWLGLFANDLLLVMTMSRVAAPVEHVPVKRSANPPATVDEHLLMEEVVVDEWPVAARGSYEDAYYRTVDELEIGALLEVFRDNNRRQQWRVQARQAATGELTLEVVGSRKCINRTRSGLAAELRRGACHVVPVVSEPKPVWERVMGWLQS